MRNIWGAPSSRRGPQLPVIWGRGGPNRMGAPKFYDKSNYIFVYVYVCVLVYCNYIYNYAFVLTLCLHSHCIIP